MTTPRAATAAFLLALLQPVAPAEAAVLPAYGTITIRDDGLGVGAKLVWTYDDALWSCGTESDGPWYAPLSHLVRCTARLAEGGPTFACPLMVLTARAGLGGRAGGRASCTRTLDTSVVTDESHEVRYGNLGAAPSVECAAYGGGLPLRPPYAVTCAEPGAPTPRAASSSR